MMLLPIMLSACAASDDGKPITFTDDRGVSSQPFPKNYRTEVLAFLKTYLNDPVGVRDAVMAEPVDKVMGPPLPTIGIGQPIALAVELLDRAPALVVLAGGRPHRVLSRTDVLDYLSRGAE